MPELLTYLHGSELVVRFQRRCGLYLLEAEHHSCARSCSPTANGHAGPRGVKQLEDRHNIQDNKHNNNQYKENGCGTPVSVFFFSSIANKQNWIICSTATAGKCFNDHVIVNCRLNVTIQMDIDTSLKQTFD